MCVCVRVRKNTVCAPMYHFQGENAEYSRGDRSHGCESVELIFVNGRVSALPSIVTILGRVGTGRRDASCRERQCQGRREISRQPSRIMLVETVSTNSVAGKS